MNASIPRRLLDSREFRALGTLARIVVRLIWRRGEEGHWPGEELLTELQSRGLFLGRAGIAEFEPVRAELLAAGALQYDAELDAHTMPILSGDRARDARSETSTARRKREQRDRDRMDPARVAARRAGRQSPTPGEQPTAPWSGSEEPLEDPLSARDRGRDNSRDTPPCHTPNVTVTGHVTSPVTVTSSGGERGGGEFSSSSSSFSEENRSNQGITAREGAHATSEAPVTAVTGSVTPDVTQLAASQEAADTPITGQEIVSAFTAHAPDRVNCVAPGRIVDRAEDLCRAQRLTREELGTMARLAARGELVGQDKRRVTDLTLLVGGREGEGGLLALWIGAARSQLAAAAKERQRIERDAAARQRALPYGAGVGGSSGTPTAAAPVGGRFSPPVVRVGAPSELRGRETG